MYEKLKTKLEKAAEDFTDLLIKRIEVASKDLSNESFDKVDNAVRMAVYITSAIERVERIDRPNRGNGTSGQEELEALLEKSRNAMLEALKSTIAKARTSDIRDNAEEA